MTSGGLHQGMFVNCANKTGVQVQWGAALTFFMNPVPVYALLTGRSSLNRTWGWGGCFLLFLIRTVFLVQLLPFDVIFLVLFFAIDFFLFFIGSHIQTLWPVGRRNKKNCVMYFQSTRRFNGVLTNLLLFLFSLRLFLITSRPLMLTKKTFQVSVPWSLVGSLGSFDTGTFTGY